MNSPNDDAAKSALVGPQAPAVPRNPYPSRFDQVYDNQSALLVKPVEVTVPQTPTWVPQTRTRVSTVVEKREKPVPSIIDTSIAIPKDRVSFNELTEKDFIKPQDNALSKFSSYTYNITLYMATPDALNEFIRTGTDNFEISKSDFYIVAQSGGISVKDKRAITLDPTAGLGPGKAGYDFYIDDLELKFVLTNTNGTPTVGTDIAFKIIEPAGFAFLNHLEVASGWINKKSKILQEFNNAMPPPLSQNYMIGIRFYGYDSAGNLMTGSNQKQSQMLTGNAEKTIKDNRQASFTRYFTFQINSLTYKIDGRVVTYYVQGSPIAKQIGHGSKFGILKTQALCEGSTVEEIIGYEQDTDKPPSQPEQQRKGTRNLIQILNDNQAKEKDKKLIEKPIEYFIKWGQGTESLRLSAVNYIVNTNAPSSSANNSSQVNAKTAANATSISSQKVLPLQAGVTVLQAMDSVFINSDYVRTTLITANDAAVETSSNPNNATTDLVWWSINPVVEVTGRDTLTKDWTYKIIYNIEMQKIQYVKSLYHRRVTPFRGVHKRYQFIYTGKNTEIISFEQKYDNQFYIAKAQIPEGSQLINPNNTTPNHVQGGSVGTNVATPANLANEINKATALRINSPADQALAQIQIYGDPDFILSNVGGINMGTTSAFEKVYGVAQNTMNPYLGQIWIAIDFNSAIDYQNDGTFKLQDIEFYKMINNVELSKISKKQRILYDVGMIYRVINVTSNFVSGKFTQTLELVLVGENELNLSLYDSRGKRNVERENTAMREANDVPDEPIPTTNPTQAQRDRDPNFWKKQQVDYKRATTPADPPPIANVPEMTPGISMTPMGGPPPEN